ncbi:uncharacterized protein LOC106160815 isoform X2 [Lingula anatina]|uniref:Glycerophosphocholine acyltransferase 1 n=1 Tax=Lingula anatina TaxID=7574 RepID=A0A1S3I435_LINAN|nr:uncharacterized protein LOC106160815 isoform X2 [Lingula anatina]|eukprot:XP_013393027.1 uncharacterized protein LOC106160815 isoform X2 [Lingula anatina]
MHTKTTTESEDNQNGETIFMDKDIPSIQKSSIELGQIKEGRTEVKGPTGIVEVAKKKNVVEKLIYVISVATVFFLAHAVITIQWVLPYYYAVSAPILILIRIILYWKLKWQLFMLDFCYLGNTLCYVYMWAAPANDSFFLLVFSIANGPLVFGALMFRNALVFHSLDKMTSVYIHLLPAYLTFGIRWFPGSCSVYWYQPFISVFQAPSFIWLLVVPLGIVLGHSALYIIVVILIIKPKKEFLDSYRYLTGKESSLVFKIINICGPNSIPIVLS